MSGLVEAATAILSQSERRVEIAAQNLANVATPGYKRLVAFSRVLEEGGLATGFGSTVDGSAGKVVVTGNPYDIAIEREGALVLRGPDGLSTSRAGRFVRDGEGRLLDPLGRALQLADGSDLVVASGDFEIRPDGTVVERGAVKGKLAVVETGNAGAALAPENILVRQGAYESSNVSNGDEMVKMMEAMRRAEAGQRVMITYDDLLGRAISSFGESGR